MEFNPCFFCSSSIYPSTPVGVGASSSLNDNAKIRNLKTPLHTFSYFLTLRLWFTEKKEQDASCLVLLLISLLLLKYKYHTYGVKVTYLKLETTSFL